MCLVPSYLTLDKAYRLPALLVFHFSIFPFFHFFFFIYVLYIYIYIHTHTHIYDDLSSFENTKLPLNHQTTIFVAVLFKTGGNTDTIQFLSDFENVR